MKIKDGFVLRTRCGEHVVTAEGRANVNVSFLISLNETAAYLFKEVKGKEFTEDTLVNLLLEEYEVEEERAREDVKALVAKWLEIGLAE